MRLGIGDPIKLFDDRTGEWLALVASTAKRDLTVTITENLRDREPVPDVWLCFAPLKKAPLDFLVEKACELGAARLVPVVTQRTVVERPKVERLQATIVEAAEQCGRTALPELASPMPLKALLADLGETRRVYFADETGGTAGARNDALEPRPGGDPDRAGGRLHRRGTRRHPRPSDRPRDHARPAHPPRRNRGRRGAGGVDGGDGGLVADHRRSGRRFNANSVAARNGCWRPPSSAAMRAP